MPECNEWIQFAIILITFVGLFIWNRTEARADSRHMDQKLELSRNETNQKLDFYRNETNQIRNETNQIIAAFQLETKQMITAIHQEMKDFHGRLCAIEERGKQK